MRILILGFTKLKFMPYINFYLSNISATEHEVHIVYWNRDLRAENTNLFFQYKLHEYANYQEDDVSKLSKIGSFLGYRKYVSNILSEIKFDRIIILHSLPGILVIDKLKKYKNRFILDYRDSTYEYFLPFRVLVSKLVKWSKTTFVSSDAFRKYLPKTYSFKIKTSHNILLDSLNHQEDKENFNISSNRIRIAFWGFIRHEEINRKLISLVAKDNRFELHYYGREQQIAINLKRYVEKLHATNIYFHGEYSPTDRYQFVRNTDCIHNLYLDNNTLLAMGNKYYDGIIFRIPQICMPSSFMGDMCKKHGVGITLNPYEEGFLDNLYDYISNIDHCIFNENCKNELHRVLSEYESGNLIIKNFIS